MLPNDGKPTSANPIGTVMPPAADPYFVIGDERDERAAGQIRAVAVFVNFELKDGNKERGHAIPLHTVPLYRRLYASGQVKLLPKWIPAIDRRRPLKDSDLNTHIEQLRTTFHVVEGSARNNIFATVFGATEPEQKRNLHAAMKTIYEAWNALQAKALERVRAKHGDAVHPQALHGLIGDHITEEELEAIIKLIEPEPTNLDSIQVDEIAFEGALTSPAAGATKAADAPAEDPIDSESDADPALQLVALLERRGYSNQTALEVAAIAIELPDGLPDEILGQVSGLQKGDGTLNRSKATAVRRVVEEWAGRAKQPAAAP